MAYQATGTAGSDTLNQSADTGPGTIVGLAGDDCILAGSGLATITGDTGNDTVVLRAGNTGTVNGGTENDSIVDNGTAIGSMQLFGGDGADTVNALAATGAQTIVGGNDSSDGADSLRGGSANDLLLGNGGNDTVSAYTGSDTQVGGFGNDFLLDLGPGNELAFGNQGNDTFNISAGNDTIWGGLGDDSVVDPQDGRSLYFGNEGNDSVDASINFGGGLTVVGGNDSADGGDSILTGSGDDLLFGNGGADTINAGTGGDTVVAGFGNDCVYEDLSSGGSNLFFGNEGDDTLFTRDDDVNTVFGGLGNDFIRMTNDGVAANRDSIQGNEGNDTIRANDGIDTISGGSGNDVFDYTEVFIPDDDGDNAAGGGPLELITDLDWSVDRFDTTPNVTFAANITNQTGADLAANANSAIAGAFALANSATAVVAAQFSFNGRTYLAIDLNDGAATTGTFSDTEDLLLDITGVTGTIGTGNFI